MYYRPRIIPTLLLDDGMMVKTKKFKNPRYLGDIINAVKIFNNKGMDEICILDISATKNGTAPNLELLHDIATEAFMPLSYGGGICKIEQVKSLFRSGFEKVIFNTALVRNPQLIQESVKFAGSQSIVASIDVKNEFLGKFGCYIRDGEERVDASPAEMARYAEKLGVGEIFLTSINDEGSMNGYNLRLIQTVSNEVDIPVIANGGAGSIEDLKIVLKKGHADAAAAGSMFVFYGRNKAILINTPTEEELINAGVYGVY